MRPRHAALADRQLLFVGAAGVCGALVLLVLIFAGARNRVKQANGEPDISPELLMSEMPDRDPDSRLIIGKGRKATGDPLQSIQTGRGELEFTNAEGLLAFRYRWDKSDPLETGWNRFTNPQAWIYRSETQLIRLTADEGLFRLAENRQPQSGVLQGHVIVSLYQSAERGGAYLIDPDQTLPVAQFETDSLNFDAMQLSGRTEDRVIARTPEMIIIGKGMSLLFNESLGRIEELEISERELIAYRPRQRLAPSSSPSPSTPSVATTSESPASTSTAAPTTAKRAAPEESEWRDVMTYHLTLTGEVIITQGESDEGLTIRGHDLAADFALRRGDIGGRLTDAPSSSLEDPLRNPIVATPGPLHAGSINRWTVLASMPFGLDEPEVTFLGSDLALGAKDVLIKGEGGLMLVPVDGTPANLVDSNDLYATLEGDPVRIDYGSFYAVGADLEYSKSRAMAQLRCTRDQPIEAGLPDGARLSSVMPFQYDFDAHKGTLLGAGTIVGLIPKETDPPQAPSPRPNSSAMKGLPEGFSVNWLNDFVVEFKGADEGSGLGQIAAAVFDGSVHVDDPNGYALDSQQLRIDFRTSDRAAAKGQEIDTITATGDAVLRSAEGNVSGDELFVQFRENAAGSSYPAQMTVTGHGRVVNLDSSIAAQYIQADLVEQSMASEEALPAKFGGSSSFAVSDLLAQGAVVLTFEDGVTAMADRLRADARTDTAVLTGENVIVSDSSLKVMGRHAEITNISSAGKDRVAKFIGAGTLTYFQPNSAEPAIENGTIDGRPVTTPEQMREELQRRLEGQPTDRQQPERTEPQLPSADQNTDIGSVHVEWADLLTFEEQEGRITFEGNVTAESEPSAREVDRLTGNWMQIELTEPVPTITATGEEGKATRRLRKMTMLGGHDEPAQVEAQRFTDESQTSRELLLAVASEIIEYTEATELFEAIGDGWMLVVDSSAPEPETTPTDRTPNSAAVQFSGPGETEFTWTGRLSLRGGPGLLTISDDVIMRHRPTGEPIIRVDCDTMTASLKSSRSVGALDLSQSEGMDLTSAVADGSVFVRREDRSIWADRLTYDRKTLLATIEALGDDYVVMEGETTGGAVQARRILWDFYTNGITVEGARIDGPMPTINPGG